MTALDRPAPPAPRSRAAARPTCRARAPTCRCRCARSSSPTATASCSTTPAVPTPTPPCAPTSASACPALRKAWIEERGDTEAYDGREVQPVDNGLKAHDHRNLDSVFGGARKPRARGHGQDRHAAALRQAGRHHARDGVRRACARAAPPSTSATSWPRGRVVLPLNVNHPESEPMAIGRELPGQDQRQHRQQRGRLLHRGGGREDDLGDPLGRRHGHGPVAPGATSTRPASGSSATARSRSAPSRSTRRWRRSTARPRTSPGRSTATP